MKAEKIENEPIDVYHDNAAIGSSKLKDFRLSALLYYRKYILKHKKKEKPSKALRMGSAFDCALLEPNDYTNRFPDFDEQDVIDIMLDSAKTHKEAMRLITEGKQQVTYRNTYNPKFALQCRPDTINEDAAYMLDVKTISTLGGHKAPKLDWQIKEFQYYEQAAFYCQVIAENRNIEIENWYWFFVETTEPFDRILCKADQAALAMHREKVRIEIRELSERYRLNDWHGCEDEVKTIYASGDQTRIDL